MEPNTDVSLSSLLRQSLSHSKELIDGTSSSPEAQQDLETTLGNLHLCARFIQHLALLSPNETLEDLTPGTLRCVLVPYWQGMLVTQRHCPGTKLRQQRLEEAKTFLQDFRRTADQYDIIDQSMLPKQTADPAAKRNAKIAAYKLEKELESKMQALEQRRGHVTVNTEEDADADAYIRPLLIAQIQLCYSRAAAELASIEQESELLQHAVPTTDVSALEPSTSGSSSSAQDDEAWRLDSRARSGKQSWFDAAQGPVMDQQGQVLRPFTITGGSNDTGGGLSTRLALKDQVFGPGHRLPTMSIDEFFDIEYERGNVLQGGEADAQRQEVESQNRKQLVEMDNQAAYDESDRRLEEERRGDEWRDTHRRGDGNRIGRG